MIGDRLESFGGLPVRDYERGSGPAGVAEFAYRLSADPWDGDPSDFVGLFGDYANRPDVEDSVALIIGTWGEMSNESSAAAVATLASVAERMPRLKALFLGEIQQEESEISWINQSDVSPLFEAYPALEEFRIRGGGGLGLGRPRHDRLRKLVIESGGLGADVLHSIRDAELPALEHLELWLGDDGYGNDCTLDDVKGLLEAAERKFPKLKYLGLRDDCRADETATAAATSSLLERIETLDISLGTLSDVGAQALLTGGRIGSLKKLDLHHHYVSSKFVEKLRAAGPEVDASEEQEPYVSSYDGQSHRYVAVSE